MGQRRSLRSCSLTADCGPDNGVRWFPVKKRYIVTGAAGHLGGTILRLLHGADAEVVGLLRQGEHPVVEGGNIRYIHY